MSVSIGIAFLAGLASTLSPCIVPVLPTFLVWVTGVAHGDVHHRGRILDRITWFCLGLIVTFTASGLLVGALGGFAGSSRWLTVIAGGLFILWGLALLDVWAIRIPRIRMPKKHHASRIGAVLFGLLFTVTWTPCIGPIYGTILTLAGGSGTALEGGYLLLAYSIGLALPFFLLGLATERTLHVLRKLVRFEHALRRTAGVLLVLFGLLFVSGLYGWAIGYMMELFPSYIPPIA